MPTAARPAAVAAATTAGRVLASLRPYTVVAAISRVGGCSFGIALSDPYLSCATPLCSVPISGGTQALQAALRDVPVGALLVCTPLRHTASHSTAACHAHGDGDGDCDGDGDGDGNDGHGHGHGHRYGFPRAAAALQRGLAARLARCDELGRSQPSSHPSPAHMLALTANPKPLTLTLPRSLNRHTLALTFTPPLPPLTSRLP